MGDRADTDDLLPIGRFARLAGLAVGALRHHDELDLLRPAEIDRSTGYGRYRRERTDANSFSTAARRLLPPSTGRPLTPAAAKLPVNRYFGMIPLRAAERPIDPPGAAARSAYRSRRRLKAVRAGALHRLDARGLRLRRPTLDDVELEPVAGSAMQRRVDRLARRVHSGA